MIKTLVHGTDKDPRLTIRAGVALIHASEDNVDQIMTDLEQSRKNAAQHKDTLRREREESNKLKRKFEDMQNERKVFKGRASFPPSRQDVFGSFLGKLRKIAAGISGANDRKGWAENII